MRLLLAQKNKKHKVHAKLELPKPTSLISLHIKTQHHDGSAHKNIYLYSTIKRNTCLLPRTCQGNLLANLFSLSPEERILKGTLRS